jgi:hypothetical protein
MSTKRIVTTVTIEAPPEQVWAALTDFGAYAEWNPFITQASGNAAPGERLKLRMQPENGRAMTFRPRVLVADAARELRWLGSLGVRGLFDGEHFFVLRPLPGDRTELVHGEEFRGVLVGLVGATVHGAEASFKRFNAALAHRATHGSDVGEAGASAAA